MEGNNRVKLGVPSFSFAPFTHGTGGLHRNVVQSAGTQLLIKSPDWESAPLNHGCLSIIFFESVD